MSVVPISLLPGFRKFVFKAVKRESVQQGEYHIPRSPVTDHVKETC